MEENSVRYTGVYRLGENRIKSNNGDSVYQSPTANVLKPVLWALHSVKADILTVLKWHGTHFRTKKDRKSSYCRQRELTGSGCSTKEYPTPLVRTSRFTLDATYPSTKYTKCTAKTSHAETAPLALDANWAAKAYRAHESALALDATSISSLGNTLNAYARAIASGGSCLKLIIVVATGERERVYRFLLEEVRKSYATEIAVHRIESWPFSARREALVVQSV